VATFGDTELTNTKQEVISERVQRHLISESVLASSVTDMSAFARKGAESVSFPRGGDFTVNNRASGAQAVQQVFNYNKDTMLLNQRATISWVVDPMDEIESVIAVQQDLVGRATRSHAVHVDQTIISELETVGVATATASPAITDLVVLEMREALLRRKANRRALYLAVAPEQESDIFGITKFVSAQDYGGGAMVPSGSLGMIYGMPVLITAELSAGQYYMFDREGIALAFQRAPMLDSRKAPEFGSGAQLYTLDQKFGVRGLQLGEQGVLAAESALVVKDNNI
jgi:hypothetical protein